MKIEIQFTRSPIQVQAVKLPSREIGACLEFQGIVRELEKGEALAGLHYEAYEPMASKTLERHLIQLGEKYGCDAVLFIHRLGWVPVGEPSLFIRILSAHRGEGIRFLADSIDLLKTDVPIWKRLSA